MPGRLNLQKSIGFFAADNLLSFKHNACPTLSSWVDRLRQVQIALLVPVDLRAHENALIEYETKTTRGSACWRHCRTSWPAVVSARCSNRSPVPCVMFRGLRMRHDRVTVLGSNGSDCFHCWGHGGRRELEARRGTLIPESRKPSTGSERDMHKMFRWGRYVRVFGSFLSRDYAHGSHHEREF
jgi:hypothetical protein